MDVPFKKSWEYLIFFKKELLWEGKNVPRKNTTGVLCCMEYTGFLVDFKKKSIFKKPVVSSCGENSNSSIRD